jgi:hypothetical protein
MTSNRSSRLANRPLEVYFADVPIDKTFGGKGKITHSLIKVLYVILFY